MPNFLSMVSAHQVALSLCCSSNHQAQLACTGPLRNKRILNAHWHALQGNPRQEVRPGGQARKFSSKCQLISSNIRGLVKLQSGLAGFWPCVCRLDLAQSCALTLSLNSAVSHMCLSKHTHTLMITPRVHTNDTGRRIQIQWSLKAPFPPSSPALQLQTADVQGWVTRRRTHTLHIHQTGMIGLRRSWM